MKPDEIRKILDICREGGVAAIEISGDSIKASFFPPMLPEMRMPPPPPPDEEREEVRPPDPDTTLQALQAQNGHG